MPTIAASTLKGHIITQAIAIAVFLVVPAVITLVVPFTDLDFRHSGAGVTVTVKRYVLMFIPWQTKEIPNVKALRVETTPEFRYRDTSENRRKGRAGAVSHATGQLVVVGDGPEEIVQAAPEMAESVSARFEQFLASRASEPVTIPVYASWRLSYLLGGTVTALAALYVIGACLAVLSFLLRMMRRKPGT